MSLVHPVTEKTFLKTSRSRSRTPSNDPPNENKTGAPILHHHAGVEPHQPVCAPRGVNFGVTIQPWHFTALLSPRATSSSLSRSARLATVANTAEVRGNESLPPLSAVWSVLGSHFFNAVIRKRKLKISSGDAKRAPSSRLSDELVIFFSCRSGSGKQTLGLITKSALKF